MFDLTISTGVQVEPPIITLYAMEGMGKSTFGSQAPNPIFIRVEDGVNNLDVAKMPVVTSFDHLMAQLDWLIDNQHDFKTVVVDTLDHLEKHIWEKIAQMFGKGNFKEISFGRGYNIIPDIWGQYINKIKILQKKKNMIIIQLAHTEIKRFNDPETESYDMYKIKLHPTADCVKEQSDMVLFANRRKAIKKEDAGFNQEKKRAIDIGDSVLYTKHRAAFYAKNRYDLPEEIPFTRDGAAWGVLAQHVPFLKQFVNNEVQNNG